MNRLVGLLARWLIWYRRRRLPPASLCGPVWYFAYGSNMNERLFRERRHMEWLEVRVGRLHGYRLAFTVAGGMRPGASAPANIVAAPSGVVHGVPLDNSEGRQYGYLWTEAEEGTGRRLPVVTFQVTKPAPEGKPARGYLNLIRDAARQRGLPKDYIDFLDRIEARE